MFYISVRISNPLTRGMSLANDWFCRGYKITKNKYFEIQIGHWSGLQEIFDFTLDARFRGRDHAGATFDLTILWFYVMFKLYDRRHWDHDANTWMVDD